jgi:hypothetical protein
MLRRLLVGLVIGLVLGGVVALGVVRGLHVEAFSEGAGGTALAYLSAVVAGLLTGLIAGKPIWSTGGKIEAGLKAFFGALLSAGGMFALRKWVNIEVDLNAVGAGHAAVGDLPAASLPLIAAVLGGFFELDNTGNGEEVEKAKGEPKRKSEKSLPSKADRGGNGKARVAAPTPDDEEEAEVAPKRAKR